jgi:hypothetical protein
MFTDDIASHIARGYDGSSLHQSGQIRRVLKFFVRYRVSRALTVIDRDIRRKLNLGAPEQSEISADRINAT